MSLTQFLEETKTEVTVVIDPARQSIVLNIGDVPSKTAKYPFTKENADIVKGHASKFFLLNGKHCYTVYPKP